MIVTRLKKKKKKAIRIQLAQRKAQCSAVTFGVAPIEQILLQWEEMTVQCKFERCRALQRVKKVVKRISKEKKKKRVGTSAGVNSS